MLGSLPRSRIIPAWASNRAKQHRIGRSADVERLARQRSSSRVERAATNEPFTQLEAVSPTLSDCAKDAHSLGYHLRTDSVARENGDLYRMDTRAGWEDS